MLIVECPFCGTSSEFVESSGSGVDYTLRIQCESCICDAFRTKEIQKTSGERTSSDDRGAEAVGEGNAAGKSANMVSSPESGESAERVMFHPFKKRGPRIEVKPGDSAYGVHNNGPLTIFVEPF